MEIKRQTMLMKNIADDVGHPTALLEVVRQGSAAKVQIPVPGSKIVAGLTNIRESSGVPSHGGNHTRLWGLEGTNGRSPAGFKTIKLSTWTSISPVGPLIRRKWEGRKTGQWRLGYAEG